MPCLHIRHSEKIDYLEMLYAILSFTDFGVPASLREVGSGCDTSRPPRTLELRMQLGLEAQSVTRPGHLRHPLLSFNTAAPRPETGAAPRSR